MQSMLMTAPNSSPPAGPSVILIQKKGRSIGKTIGLGVLGLVVLFIALAVVLAVIPEKELTPQQIAAASTTEANETELAIAQAPTKTAEAATEAAIKAAAEETRAIEKQTEVAVKATEDADWNAAKSVAKETEVSQDATKEIEKQTAEADKNNTKTAVKSTEVSAESTKNAMKTAEKETRESGNKTATAAAALKPENAVYVDPRLLASAPDDYKGTNVVFDFYAGNVESDDDRTALYGEANVEASAGTESVVVYISPRAPQLLSDTCYRIYGFSDGTETVRIVLTGAETDVPEIRAYKIDQIACF